MTRAADRQRTTFIPTPEGRTIVMPSAEDPRIAILRPYGLTTGAAVELLAKLDAAPKPLPPLTPHSEHFGLNLDERCVECFAPEV